VGGVMMLLLGFYPSPSPALVLVILSLSQLAVGMLALALSTYTAELYPTELRALGSGFGNAWLRLGGTAGPAFIGAMLPVIGLQGIFISFGVLLGIGFVVCALFAIETRGRLLEQLSPSLDHSPRTGATAEPALGAK
jgi:MFS transporter, putative metabolite:H+ symporter